MKTMLDIFKTRLPKGMTIKKTKEYHNKYVLTIEYEGDATSIDLVKTCQPGYDEKVCDTAVITAMSNIYFNRGDLVNCKKWLDKLFIKETENND